MKRSIAFMCMLMIAFAAGTVSAKRTAINVPSENVEASEGLLTIDVALPAGVVGQRIDRAVLEVPIAVGESADAAFNAFPMIELYQVDNAEAKQTVLLAANHGGLVRIDVTGLVRTWTTTDARQFVVGIVSRNNKTVFEQQAHAAWPSGTKARLVVEYRDRSAN